MTMATPRWWKTCSLLAFVLLLAACGGTDSTAPTKALNLTGTWSMVGNNYTFTLTIQHTGTVVTGTMHPLQGGADTPIDGTLNGTAVSFTRRWSSNTQVFTGTVSAGGNTMEGTFSHNGSASTYLWSAQR
jgi:hypothetical protein